MPGRFPGAGPFGFRSDFNTVPRRPQVASVLTFAERNNTLLDTPSLLLQAVIVPGDKTLEGQLVQAVALPWFEIIELVSRSPEAIYEIDWRKWEEIIAAAYKQQGFEVTLTPRSNDKGRDIIATRSGLGSVRFFDQVKAYRPGHVVTAEEVRAMVGVLTLEPNVSKGLVTTTSTFAPGILQDPEIARLTPYRLELKAKDALLDWLVTVAKNSGAA
jgi:restriction system protein